MNANDDEHAAMFENEAESLLAAARSQDRIDIYLTPSRNLDYTRRRVALRLRRPRAPMPWAKLFVVPEGPVPDPDTASLYPLVATGMREILIDPASTEVQFPLSAKLRDLAEGSYVASYVVLGPTGAREIVERVEFSSTDPGIEWILPATRVTLAPGTSLQFRLTKSDCGTPVYESAPIAIRRASRPMSHHYVFGKAGSRLLDLLFAICASALLSVPFGLLTLYIRYLVTRRFPEVAEERRRAARSALGRFLAPAFFCDSSRWVLRNGALVPGKVYKLETLNPVEKTLLLGQWSNLLRRWAVDELPQLLVTLTGGWSLFGPRSVPNRSGGLLTGGTRVDELRDYLIRYRMGGVMRKPGAISLRVAMTPRGSVEMPPWKSMLLCDRYDSSHWSGAYALRVVLRVLLSFLWAEAAADSYGPVESRVAPLSSAAAWGRSAASGG